MTAALWQWLAAGWLPPVEPAAGARLAAVAAAGVAVKLMDDVLDRAEDEQAGRPNVAARLGPAATAYALAALAVATALSLRDALLLFWASYAWGMAHGAGARLPLGLRAWQETALAVALAALAAGVPDTLAALALVGAVQLLDDWVDLRRETARVRAGPPQPARGPAPRPAPAPTPFPGRNLQAGDPDDNVSRIAPARNWATRLGAVEALLVGLALGLLAAAWDPLRAAAAGAVALAAGLASRGPKSAGTKAHSAMGRR
ncbi:hypothetical protein Tmar_1078 [Thermaerobacter marianensis DSM 12885]|uniref:UbiA prenyltransferase n=1 Tax=Thermaerobacter marianensis (strain ATCC 700841 / DSM 12885 / JCM 10246 / 7p75a) TaxID=644966 RepID=E6SK50_THEM7|nr:hypothetical protein [Thermaerobacter marianensis]ADU51191.1 hypothetical protein Tmar_1078 [Thermaerobacter marianensis DSM 12885]